MGNGNFKTVCTCAITLLLAQSGFSDQLSVSPKEALTIRRITEYWRDADYASAKRQIIDFLEKNPQTTLRDPLRALLGDLYFQEKNYRQALATYDLVGKEEIRQKILFHSLQAHFEVKEYPSVIEQAQNYLKAKKEQDPQIILKVRYLLAEAAFRMALRTKEQEKKLHCLQIAKPQLKILTQTEYRDRALFSLAETCRLLKENSQAANLFLQLADRYPSQRERFIFQATLLQVTESKQEAIRSFHKVYQMGGKLAKLAVFNELVLLYQSERYEEYIALFNKVSQELPSRKVPLLQFYEGHGFYALGEYAQAISTLEGFIEAEASPSKERKTALLLLVNCSRQLKDNALFERTMYSFKKSFPKDPELAEVFFIHAQICRENGNLAGALEDYQALLQDHSFYEKREVALYEMGIVLEQVDQLKEAQKTFLTFIDQYPESERQDSAWKHLLNCCNEEFKNPTQVHSTEAKEHFAHILTVALKKKGFFSENEHFQYMLVKIKFLVDLNKYSEAIPQLNEFLSEATDTSHLSEAHLLMALCQKNVGGTSGLFIFHSEKALKLYPNLPDSEILHLELYNAYLHFALSEQKDHLQHRLFAKAAEHLFNSNIWKTGTIKQNNLIWLAHHYYERAKEDDAHLERTASLFNVLLGTSNGMSSLLITDESVELEGEVLKFAYLLGLHKRSEDQLALLEALVRKQEEQPDLNWKLKRRTIFELAKAYENSALYENALHSYQFLVESGGSAGSLITNAAQLHLARLQYRLLPSEKKQPDHPDVIGVLHKLKDLQIQKRLPAEPIHLEAALEYVELRSCLASPEKRIAITLFFLQRMREDFTTREDLIAKEYNALKIRFPEKELIFNAYMRYIESEMLKWQAQIAYEEKDEDLALQYEEQALEILNELLENTEPLRPYLLERVRRSRAQFAEL